MPEDYIEGESRELMVVERLTTVRTPEDTIGLATRMATALKDIVEKQRLYAVINGRKYPQVEAWMTIARMDNVVAREVPDGIMQREDGAFEATVELVRLSDGMIVGRGSALCGTAGDEPWHTKRPDPAKRSMAVTRATSRAFRQQYSWIMALAGYEPTPAEEMPRDEAPEAAVVRDVTPPAAVRSRDGSLIGTAELGSGSSDFLPRPGPKGSVLSFRLRSGRQTYKVVAEGDLAEDLALCREDVLGKTVTCWGRISTESFTPAGKSKPIEYQVLTLERLSAGDLLLPAEDRSAPSEAMFAEGELEAVMAKIP